jgi:flavin-dependent dehydrogenase
MSAREVVVVGGRVAGASTALLLARAGHDVVLVDRADPTGDTLSTHALMRTGVLQLKRWGLLDELIEAGTPPIEKVTLGFGDEIVRFTLGDEYGVASLYAPRRQVLDGILLDECKAAGVEVKLGCRALGILRDDSGRVDGLMIDRRGQRSTLRARFVVGADGVYSRIAGAVEARTLRRHGPQNSVIYGYFEGVEATGYEFQFTPGFNVGIIPSNDGQVNVFAAFKKHDLKTSTERTFQEALRRAQPDIATRVEAGTRIGGFRKTPGIPCFIKQSAGPGWVLVGDAGFTKDPISAHGISDALRDAELAAAAIHESLVSTASEQSALRQYQTDRDRFAFPLYEESRALSAYRWDAAEASMRLRRLSAITNDECAFLASRAAPSRSSAAA